MARIDSPATLKTPRSIGLNVGQVRFSPAAPDEYGVKREKVAFPQLAVFVFQSGDGRFNELEPKQ